MKELINKLSQKKIPNLFNLDTISTWNEALETATEIIKQHQMMINGVDENGLKFCPFCGSQVKIYDIKDYADNDPHYEIRCQTCNVHVTHVSGKKELVINKWNLRS